MAKQFKTIGKTHRAFVERQKIFFTATAAPGARVNISPRPTDCLRVLDERRVCYLDRTGSGAETAAHIRADGPMTIMLCAFEGPPRILRLYGRGRIIAHGTPDYATLLADNFEEEYLGARHIVMLEVDLVQTSCGFGVPLFDYQGERDGLDRWANAQVAENPDALVEYRRAHNTVSIDGLPTGMFD